MGLSRTVSQTDDDFSVENRKFFPPRVFYAPADFELQLVIGARGQKLEWWG